jgi:heme-degrading monooxygenase HmoA
MTVTELAVLHTLPNGSSKVPSEKLLAKLKSAKEVLESNSGYSFSFFQQYEDPTVIYIVGRWLSTAAHEAFLPSSQNLALLDLFKGQIDIENILMYHLELDADATPLPLNAPAVSVNRHFIKHRQRDAFQKRFEQVKPLLQDYTKPRPLAGGWRIEKETEEKEEWVLFSGFDSVEHHIRFSKTDEFQNYRGISEYVDGFDLKHMKRLEGI